MQETRRRDFPEDKYTNVFLGYGPEDSQFAVELTYNYGVTSYDIGEGFGHFGVATTDVYAMVDKIKAAGGKVRSTLLLDSAQASSERDHTMANESGSNINCRA